SYKKSMGNPNYLITLLHIKGDTQAFMMCFIDNLKILRLVVPFLVILIFTGCSSDNDVEIDFVFMDGFESHSGELGELFPDDNSRWSNIQKVDPTNGKNTVELVTEPVSEGAGSLRLVASASDDVLSKMDIEKGGFEVPVGSYIIMEMDLFLNSDENLADLLLMDLECCAC
ncbi:MAG: hypothetical protein RJQ14_18710, partial [Marinoscillum sp.]